MKNTFPTFPSQQPDSIQHPVSKEHLFTEEEMIAAQLEAQYKRTLEEQISYIGRRLLQLELQSRARRLSGERDVKWDIKEARTLLAIKENIIAVRLLESLQK